MGQREMNGPDEAIKKGFLEEAALEGDWLKRLQFTPKEPTEGWALAPLCSLSVWGKRG